MFSTKLASKVFNGAIALLALVAFLFLSFIFLGNRIVPGTPWKKLSDDGPLMLGNQRAGVFERCALIEGYMSHGSCEIGFADHRNKKIRWDDIREDIVDSMTKIPALAPRLRRFDEDFSKKPSHIQAPVVIRYMMHLVTLSLMVVIVTPDQFYQAGSCGGSPATGCIASSRTGAELFYQSVIQVVPGSFIFSTDAPTEFQSIPRDARHIEFQLPDSQLQLTAANGVWRIRRDERK